MVNLLEKPTEGPLLKSQKDGNDKTKEEKESIIELIDIQDIVPKSGNSTFLCISRSLIYMANKDAALVSFLESTIGLKKEDFSNDISLQLKLRTILCKYWCEFVYYDEDLCQMRIKSDYAK